MSVARAKKVAPLADDARLQPVNAYFAARGWTPFAFQLEVWTRFLSGESGLLQVPTGAGKTYAATMGAFSALLRLKTDAAAQIALHHGSISQEERERVEAGLKSSEVRWAVATSSLDLGVDFQPVERVVQIGSPKGIARFLQRPTPLATRVACCSCPQTLWNCSRSWRCVAPWRTACSNLATH